MASIATAVLPVCLSPIINSLCPRPIGIIASTAAIPVCNGSVTGCLATTPRALRSIGKNCVDWIAPLPSIGIPNGVTTLPRNSSPTGIEATRLVRLTVSPSLISELSPKRTQPTLSSSRLRTIPITSFGNSTSSLAITWESPYTCAIPSPTASTVPTS